MLDAKIQRLSAAQPTAMHDVAAATPDDDPALSTTKAASVQPASKPTVPQDHVQLFGRPPDRALRAATGGTDSSVAAQGRAARAATQHRTNVPYHPQMMTVERAKAPDAVSEAEVMQALQEVADSLRAGGTPSPVALAKLQKAVSSQPELANLPPAARAEAAEAIGNVIRDRLDQLHELAMRPIRNIR